jgi:hypothetical protein
MQPSGKDGFVEMQANFTLTGTGASKSEGLCQYVQPAGTCPFAAWSREPAAVDLTGTKNVTFLRNTFDHLGGAGLGLQHGGSTTSCRATPSRTSPASESCSAPRTTRSH